MNAVTLPHRGTHTDARPVERILVAIANHGTANRRHVDRLLATFRNYDRPVDVVVLSDAPKDLGSDVEVRVGAPTNNPWSLPFAHRRLFVERQNEYDLFIYCEDDTEITEAHVEAFLSATKVLPSDCIAGFIRYELGPDGQRYYSTMHGPYHWDPASIVTIDGEVYARYTNEHAAAFMLTRAQLRHCIASGGFDVPPHEGRYDMLVSAATDPYVCCGLKKLVCLSRLPDFTLHHLPDKYLGRIGIETEEVDAQVERIIEIARSGGPRAALIEPAARFPTIMFDKNYEEPVRPEVVAAIGSARSVLSVGCDRGLTEARLVDAGIDVTAVPLDPVIAVSAERRGIVTMPADLEEAWRALAGRSFECILFNNVLSHVAAPDALIGTLKPFLAERGRVVVAYDNGWSPSCLRRAYRGGGLSAALRFGRDFGESRYHRIGARGAIGWLRAAGLRPDKPVHVVTQRFASVSRATGGFVDGFLCERGLVVGHVPD